jgi:ribosomal RNA assembly protein
MIDTEFIKVPMERIKVFKEDDSKIIKTVEEKCNVKIEIDTDGEVSMSGDPTDLFFAKDVVKAIARGFSPNEALKLTIQDYNFTLINLKEEFSSENAITRLKGRVIGEKGKVKSEIEASTECNLSIYGSTIGIIGKIDTISYATEAVNMILDGAPISTVTNYLAKAKREILESRLKSK